MDSDYISFVWQIFAKALQECPLVDLNYQPYLIQAEDKADISDESTHLALIAVQSMTVLILNCLSRSAKVNNYICLSQRLLTVLLLQITTKKGSALRLKSFFGLLQVLFRACSFIKLLFL